MIPLIVIDSDLIVIGKISNKLLASGTFVVWLIFCQANGDVFFFISKKNL